MPNPETRVSPGQQGAETGKPEAGSQTTLDGSNVSSEPTRPSYEELQKEYQNVKRDYAAAQQESYQNYLRYQQAQQQLSQLNQPRGNGNQGGNQPVSNQNQQGDFLSEEDARQLQEAVFDQDPVRIRQALSSGFSKAASYGAQAAVGALHQQMTQSQQNNMRIAPSQRYLTQNWSEITNVKSPVTQRMIQIYQQMENARVSGQDFLDIADDRMPMGTAQVNIHLLRRAHEQAKREIGTSDGGQEILNRSGQSFVEPSSGAPNPATNKSKNVEKLLTDQEKVWAKRANMTYEEYFNSFNPRLQEARRQRGGPVNSNELYG